jgi:hypothetical protein
MSTLRPDHHRKLAISLTDVGIRKEVDKAFIDVGCISTVGMGCRVALLSYLTVGLQRKV